MISGPGSSEIEVHKAVEAVGETEALKGVFVFLVVELFSESFRGLFIITFSKSAIQEWQFFFLLQEVCHFIYIAINFYFLA